MPLGTYKSCSCKQGDDIWPYCRVVKQIQTSGCPTTFFSGNVKMPLRGAEGRVRASGHGGRKDRHLVCSWRGQSKVPVLPSVPGCAGTGPGSSQVHDLDTCTYQFGSKAAFVSDVVVIRGPHSQALERIRALQQPGRGYAHAPLMRSMSTTHTQCWRSCRGHGALYLYSSRARMLMPVAGQRSCCEEDCVKPLQAVQVHRRQWRGHGGLPLQP